MKYQDAVKVHGKNEGRYWSCTLGCADCCPSGRKNEILVPATLFDVWREYVLNNPDGLSFYNVAYERFSLGASEAGALLEYPDVFGLNADAVYPVFSRGRRCKNLSEDETGCRVHGTVVQGPNCLSMPEGNLAKSKHKREMMYKDRKTQEVYPCIIGKILRPEDKVRCGQLWHISKDEMGVSMQLMHDYHGFGAHPAAQRKPTFQNTVEESLYFFCLEKDVRSVALLTTQAMGRIIGQDGLEDTLRKNHIEPHGQAMVNGFLEKITAKKMLH